MTSSVLKIIINVNGQDIEFSSLEEITELRDLLNEMIVSKTGWIYYPYPMITPTTYTITCGSSSTSPDCVNTTLTN
jgi:hypothetical protein